MLAVKIVISVIFMFFSFYFLMMGANDKGKSKATITNFVLGTILAIATFAMWYLPLG